MKIIVLPDGRKLITLKDGADYVTELPKEQSDLARWQVAIKALMLCSRGVPLMMARIGVMKALNRHVGCLIPIARETLGQTKAEAGRMKTPSRRAIASAALDIGTAALAKNFT